MEDILYLRIRLQFEHFVEPHKRKCLSWELKMLVVLTIGTGNLLRLLLVLSCHCSRVPSVVTEHCQEVRRDRSCPSNLFLLEFW